MVSSFRKISTDSGVRGELHPNLFGEQELNGHINRGSATDLLKNWCISCSEGLSNLEKIANAKRPGGLGGIPGR